MDKIKLWVLPVSPYEGEWLYLYIVGVLLSKLRLFTDNIIPTTALFVYYTITCYLCGMAPVAIFAILLWAFIVYLCL